MGTSQTDAERASKSRGHGGAGGAASDRLDDASSVHGVGRVGSGFNLVEVVSEYRALRATVLRLWRESNPPADLNDIDDITRFNESIDQSLAKAVAGYTKRVDQARRMFLAILAHDLRNPLNTISLSAAIAAQTGAVDPDSSHALSQIENSVQAIAQLIKDLTDFASTGLGAAMPLSPAPMNLHRLCAEVVKGMQTAHPTQPFASRSSGDATITGDAARLRQVLSNLLGNAVQHGAAGAPITVSIADEGSDVVLTTHNAGAPIPPELLPMIFDPLVRGSGSGGGGGGGGATSERRRPGSVGLGLYIVREIVAAHGGSVEVTSSDADGTRFTVRLPRHGPPALSTRSGKASV
jgi:signal transduction histidine kinase